MKKYESYKERVDARKAQNFKRRAKARGATVELVPVGGKQLTQKQQESLDAITVKSGAHNASEKEYCIMEAVSFITGQRHSDEPVCVAPVLTRSFQRVNDYIETDLTRNKLKELVPQIVSTDPFYRSSDGFTFKAYDSDEYLELSRKRQKAVERVNTPTNIRGLKSLLARLSKNGLLAPKTEGK